MWRLCFLLKYEPVCFSSRFSRVVFLFIDCMCVGSVDATDPVLSSLSQSSLTAAIRQPADTLGTHEYSQRHGRSQEAQADVLVCFNWTRASPQTSVTDCSLIQCYLSMLSLSQPTVSCPSSACIRRDCYHDISGNLNELRRMFIIPYWPDTFWRSKVKVTAGRRGGEGIHVDARASKSPIVWVIYGGLSNFQEIQDL